MNALPHTLLLVLGLLCLAACTTPRPPLVESSDMPPVWQSASSASEITTTSGDYSLTAWLDTFDSPLLQKTVAQAVAANYALAQEALQVDLAAARVRQSRADRLPQLSATVGGQRARAADSSLPIVEQVDLGLSVGLNLDLWGQLSDAQRQAVLEFQAQQMRYVDAERALAASVVTTLFNVMTSNQLQALFNQRLDNLLQGLDVIERGYRSGLNEALDVYLARTTVQQQRANVANQQQVNFEATTRLELLVADYPAAAYTVTDGLPALPPAPEVGIPSALLQRRPDIRQAWLSLLAADASLAVAHKARFPNLRLTASVRDADNSLSRLLDGGALGFTAAASLLQPVFQGGRLRAAQEQARVRVALAEQRYLQVVYAALAEVENELQRATTLSERYDAFIAAERHAEAALELANDQYQRGLVTFTTVLEAQRRAFDAQTTVINLRNQLLQSRVALLLALGGHY